MSLEPVYDRLGRVQGWTAGEHLYSMSGDAIGWLWDTRYVYSHTGLYIGWFEQGQYWDSQGAVVAWTIGSSGGPNKPSHTAAPSLPSLSGIPGRPGFSGIMGKPGFGGAWSDHNWESWLKR